MFPKVNRLERRDLLLLKKNGLRIESEFLKLIYFKSDFERTSKFAIVVSKKISKKAVVRNRIKRLIRREVLTNLPFVKRGVETVIIVKFGSLQTIEEKISKEVVNIFKKAGIIEEA